MSSQKSKRKGSARGPSTEASMEVLVPCCAGLDVHKKTVVACVRCMVSDTTSVKETRSFNTMTEDILALGDWLASHGVTDVAMESTGVFWKPIWNLLEDRFHLILCNAQHVKQVPGRKTDTKDSEWLAQLLQHGLLRASFVPPRPQRDLRDLTRSRAQLISDITRVANRIQKILEDANIKLASVATDILGVSGRAMLEAIIRGDEDPNALAELARRRLREKIPELRQALTGHIREHHRFLLGRYYQQLKDLEHQVALFNERIRKLMDEDHHPEKDSKSAGVPNVSTSSEDAPSVSPENRSENVCTAHANTSCVDAPSEFPEAAPDGSCTSTPVPPAQYDVPVSFHQALELLDEIPGINLVTAENIIVEIGVDMNQFPTADHASSWAGLSPGNNESAGKRKSGKTTKGNRWLRRAINQAAWAASHTKDSYLSAFYRRIVPRRGKKRAIVALGHTLMVIVYHILKTGRRYYELGSDYFDQLNHDGATRYHKKRLEELGYQVNLQLDEAAT